MNEAIEGKLIGGSEFTNSSADTSSLYSSICVGRCQIGHWHADVGEVDGARLHEATGSDMYSDNSDQTIDRQDGKIIDVIMSAENASPPPRWKC